MHGLLSLLIVAAAGAAPMESESGETIYEMRFEQADDVNFDRWPDHWRRKRGIDFPEYLEIQIVDDPEPLPGSQHCLRMELDGGGAAIFSPPIPISPLFSYLFEGAVKTEELARNIAYLSVTFYDAERQYRETFRSPELRDAGQWQRVRIGPVTPARPEMSEAVIGLHLVPTDRPDLFGAAMFDELQFVQLPKISLRTNGQRNLFHDPDQVEVRCVVSGIQRPDAYLVFELCDEMGRQLASHRVEFNSAEAAEPVASAPDTPAHTASWYPPIHEDGFYQLSASMFLGGQRRLRRSVTLAVVQPTERQTSGEFGWSLPRGADPLPLDELAMLLGQVGINWVKFPAWFAADDAAAAERLAWFADRLSSDGIEMVGMLDEPPADVRAEMGNKQHLSVAEAFLEPDVWKPAMNRIMLRLSLKVEWWQLGADSDNSFFQLPTLAATIAEIRDYFRQYSQRTRVGLPWRWIEEPPAVETPPWDFLAMTVDPPLTGRELTQYLNQFPAHATAWTTLTPLPEGQYDTATRARDLALRMIAAKMGGAETIFLADPFDPATGILQQDGSPTALFLPWCTTARMVTGCRHLGSLALPGGSRNHVLQRDGQIILVVWNDRPTTETLYLGDEVRQVDLWGRAQPVQTVDSPQGPKQQLAIGRMPVFLVGLQPAVARWRLQCQLEQDRLPGVFGQKQWMAVRFQNTFSQGIGGSVRLIAPRSWDVRGRQSLFKLAADESVQPAFGVEFHTDTSNGPQPLRFDFDVNADRRYRFSVYREIRVGLGDVDVTLNTWLDNRGRLIVEQQLINHTDKKLDFNCLLFVPNRRRLRQRVHDLGAGQVTTTFVIADGEGLIGQTLWFRAEEIGGSRLLNYRIVAQP